MLDHIFNWRLLPGSHDFPGPDGGTCINEAAILAAGFEYKAVQSASDCPPCFSRPLSAYLIRLNDRMPDSKRQKLMRFVLRLPGSADAGTVERQRTDLIVVETVRRILPIVLRRAGLHAHADACAVVTTREQARQAAAAAATIANAAYTNAAASAAANAATNAAIAAAYTIADAAIAAANAAASAARAATVAADIWSLAIELAEQAFAIGRQATLDDVAAVTCRLEAAKVPA